MFERNVFLKFLSQILKLLTGRVFEFLKPFGIRFFNFRRQPEPLGQ